MPLPELRIQQTSAASFASVRIETYFKDENGKMRPVGTGTGFFIKLRDVTYLVTNWHVVTGRNSNQPQKLLPGYQTSPTHFQILRPRTSGPNNFQHCEFMPLYDDSTNPRWIESHLGPEMVDIAVIPCKLPQDAVAEYVDNVQIVENTVLLRPGLDVIIIGFPFGMDIENPFPIWKRAMIASEPRFTIKGKPYAFLDTPGRPGMSGSPVYTSANGFFTSAATAQALQSGNALDAIRSLDVNDMKAETTVLRFIGIYAGSLGDEKLDQLNLGRFFPSYHLNAIEKTGRLGTNPYPPIFFEKT